MREELSREKMHKAIDTTLAGLNGDPWLFQRVAARAEKGDIKVKKKLSVGLVLAIVMLLLAAVAVAVTLLTHQQVVEQVAVPLAVENDDEARVNDSFNAEELAELVRSLNENGITLEENNAIMQAMQSGQGYYEEETIMEICRQAFGGYFFTWTLEEQDWFQHLMVDIGYYESYESCLPGEDNMPYEEAEAFALRRIREEYGEELPLEDRSIWQLERQFYHDTENGGEASWNFTLNPRDVEHGMYAVQFEDRDPAGTAFVQASIPDWTKPYTGEELMMKFYSVYSWFQGKWPQQVWQQLHEMMQNAQLNTDDNWYPQYLGYQLTAYPEPAEGEITREDAIRIAKEALGKDRAVMDSALLTEYEGKRAWLVCLMIFQPEDEPEDEDAGTYVVTVDSISGQVESLRKQGLDDNSSMAYVPQPAYDKAREGILTVNDYIRIAAEAIQAKYPDLDPLNKQEFETQYWGGRLREVNFISRNVKHGNATVTVAADGTVSEVTADVEPLTGDNLFARYWAAEGYFGQWDQDVWVRLDADMETLTPQELEGRLLKATHYPAEDTVRIGHEQAQKLGMQATGKRMTEVNTCTLVAAEPHPVWIMRILTDEDDDPVIGIDAETGEVAFREQFKVDYTPHYVLFSLPQTWRKMELETLGAPYMAQVALTHQFADMELDEPDLGLENDEDWTMEQEGLTIRYTGRWAGMKRYEVELDENGFVLRCEEGESPATEPKPEESEDAYPEEQGEPVPTPTPRPDGKLWFWEKDFEDAAFWQRMEEAMRTYGVTGDNLAEKEKEWQAAYGNDGLWPQDCFVLEYFLSASDEWSFEDGYAIFVAPGKPDKEAMQQKAREAFHQVADETMGTEWVDSLLVGGYLWSDGFNYETGTRLGHPMWFFTMQEEEDGNWNPKGFVTLDEDGNVINASLELDSNG